MDKLQWFKFTPSDWMMGKIQRCPEITQARFMRLCCLYWNKEANLLRDDAIIEIEQEHYDILISKKIIQDDGAHVFIQFLDEQLEDITLTSKSKSRAAKIRWERYNAKQVQSTSNADAMHVHTDAMQNDAEKRREEEREKREENTREELPKKLIVFSEDVTNTYYSILEFFDESTHPSNDKIINNWKDTIDKLNRLDGLSFNDIIHLVKETREDDFWSSNFLSITKLRKKNKEDIPYWKVFYNKFKQSNINNKSINYEQLNEIRRQHPDA